MPQSSLSRKLIAVLLGSLAAVVCCALALAWIRARDPSFTNFSQARIILVGPPPDEVRAICGPTVEWIRVERESLGYYRPALEYSLWAELERLPYDIQYESPNLVVGSRQWPFPLLAYTWSPEEGWSWSADREISDEQVAELLRERGYYSEEKPRYIWSTGSEMLDEVVIRPLSLPERGQRRTTKGESNNDARPSNGG